MSASIWSPDGTVPSDAPPDYIYKRIWLDIAAGQTLVNFALADATFVYTPGLQSLEVGIDGGMPLQPGVDYTETSPSSITLIAPSTDVGRLYAAVGRPINVSPSGLDASLIPYTFPDGVVRSVQDLATTIGTNGIGFIAAGTGSVDRTAQDKLREVVSIVDKGADPTGAADSTPAITLSAAQNAGVNFVAGTYQMGTSPTVSSDNLFEFYPGVTTTGAGAAITAWDPTIKRGWVQPQTAPDEFATIYIRRDSTHAGGTPGYVSSALKVDLYARNAGTTEFQWALQARLDNASDQGENVAFYAKGIKRGLGQTWGACIEAIQEDESANPVLGIIGLEIDCRANGTDNNNARIALDIAADRAVKGAAATNVVAFGVRLQSGISIGDTGNIYKTGYGFETGQQTFVGFDAAPGVHSLGAFKMKEDQTFVMSADNTKNLRPTATGIELLVSGTPKSRLNWNGSIALNDARFVITGVNTAGGAGTASMTNKPGASSNVFAWIDVSFDGTACVMPIWLKA